MIVVWTAEESAFWKGMQTLHEHDATERHSTKAWMHLTETTADLTETSVT